MNDDDYRGPGAAGLAVALGGFLAVTLIAGSLLTIFWMTYSAVRTTDCLDACGMEINE